MDRTDDLVAQVRARTDQAQAMWSAYRDDRPGPDTYEVPRRRAPLWVPTALFVRLAYEVLLRREPDESGLTHYVEALRERAMTRDQVLDELRSSMEFRDAVVVASLNTSLHHSRCDFIRMLPPARRILDLGGTHHRDPRGSLVAFGYPYPFESLTIVDLPPDQRHAHYDESRVTGTVDTELGPVTYHEGTMTDLSFRPDASVDLVYSGQTIEHVTEADGDLVLAEVTRVLVPGGRFCLDTPNGPMCQREHGGVINDDHKVEYGDAQLQDKLRRAGFEVEIALGLNHFGRCAGSGFDVDEIIRHPGLHWDAEHCYLLAYVARKPG